MKVKERIIEWEAEGWGNFNIFQNKRKNNLFYALLIAFKVFWIGLSKLFLSILILVCGIIMIIITPITIPMMLIDYYNNRKVFWKETNK